MSCGATHSHARELLTQGYQTALVAATLMISRSSLYYRPKVRRSRADRRYDEQIIAACGEKPTFGYRRVTLRLQRKQKLRINTSAFCASCANAGCWCCYGDCDRGAEKSGAG